MAEGGKHLIGDYSLLLKSPPSFLFLPLFQIIGFCAFFGRGRRRRDSEDEEIFSLPLQPGKISCPTKITKNDNFFVSCRINILTFNWESILDSAKLQSLSRKLLLSNLSTLHNTQFHIIIWFLPRQPFRDPQGCHLKYSVSLLAVN